MATPYDAVGEYNKSLESAKKNAILMTGLGAIHNIGAMQQARNAPNSEPLVARRLNAPYMTSPGSAIINSSVFNRVAESGNANRRLALEMGRPDLAVAINDAEKSSLFEYGMAGLESEYETMAKNSLAAAETDRINAEVSMQTDAANKQMWAAENEMDSKTIAAALESLYQMGFNLSDMLGTSNYYKLLANQGQRQINSQNADVVSDLKIG